LIWFLHNQEKWIQLFLQLHGIRRRNSSESGGPGNSSDDIEAVVIESAATASVVIEAGSTNGNVASFNSESAAANKGV